MERFGGWLSLLNRNHRMGDEDTGSEVIPRFISRKSEFIYEDINGTLGPGRKNKSIIVTFS